MLYITTYTELASVQAFMVNQSVNNVWFQVLSSNLAPNYQYYDDTTIQMNQFSNLVPTAANIGPRVPSAAVKCKVSSNSVGCCGYLQTWYYPPYNSTFTSVIIDDCTTNRPIICKYSVPSPPPPTSPSPPWNSAAAASITYVVTMRAVLQMDYPSLVNNATKLAQFKIDFCNATTSALIWSWGCNVVSISSSSVVRTCVEKFAARSLCCACLLSA